MKKIIYVFFAAMVLISCKNESKKENFPDALGKVFEKHGGIDAWRNANTLSFNKGDEAHTVDLKSRKTTVHSPKYSMGYNSKEVWIKQQDSTAFKMDPKFYYNLYFYFYAMPFVLADNGIIYEEAKPLTFEGKEYPGFKISYESNVGTSPEDNYFVYYNPKTYQMEWLKYSVTFFSKKPSDKFNVIRYNDWETVDGFVLPKSITWYKKDDNGLPTKPRGPSTEFTLAIVKKAKLQDTFFEKPTQ
ncbi:MAG: hypothetical protein JXQ93_13885 [Flavobacteriaceae bacterium]